MLTLEHRDGLEDRQDLVGFATEKELLLLLSFASSNEFVVKTG